jgi:hypothetical protein
MRAMTPRISTFALWRSVRRLLSVLGLLALLLLGTAAAIVVQAGRSEGTTADAAVVLLDDGSGTEARLERVRRLYSDGRVGRIVLAGAGGGERRATLQARGVAEDAIVELDAPDQLRLLQGVKQTLDDEQLQSALLLAEPVETLRLLKIARDTDLRVQSQPLGNRDLDVRSVLNEVGRYFGYVLLGR